MAKPRIFVSSTYYDLKHIRNSLEAFIESFGYDAVLFESGDIAFRHDKVLDESCYAEIQNCHMLVLIIGGKYGSPASETPAAKSEDEMEKVYEAYNSITKIEYEKARLKDIPIFIFVEKNVRAEFQTFKSNRDNKTIKYAHVDNVNVFRLLDDILQQKRNNFIQSFENFEDISSWLRAQWSGLFAEFLGRESTETTLRDLASQVNDLQQVTAALKKYTEAILSKINPQESEKIISDQEKISQATVLRRFSNSELFSLLKTYKPDITEEKAIDALIKSDSVDELIKELEIPKWRGLMLYSDAELRANYDYLRQFYTRN